MEINARTAAAGCFKYIKGSLFQAGSDGQNKMSNT